MSTPRACRLGLPAWAYSGWRDRYFTAAPSQLASYASVFNTVEGNTSFYRVADAATVERWRRAVAGRDFEFCFKLPRTVTHERHPSHSDLDAFLHATEPLADALGPLLVQFPATVGPPELDAVAALLEQLPRSRRAVLEVRHPQFFENARQLEPLLQRFQLGRVVLDARAVHRGDRNHPEVRAALHEKPDLPVLDAVYNGLAFVRLVLHPDRLDNQRYIDEWAARVAGYLARGDATYVMIHCPNNLHCPELARQFHETLAAQPLPWELAPLPDWPVPQQSTLL